MVLKQMKDKILADVSAALDKMVIQAKENGIVHVKEVDVKITATYPLAEGTDATVEVVSRLNVKPE